MLRPAHAALLVLLASTSSPATSAQPPAGDAATGLIVGRVVDAGTGRPVSGVTVSLSGPLGGERQGAGRQTAWSSPPPWILTSGDGYFVFRAVPAGSYLLAAQRPGYFDGASGRVRPGGPVQQLTIASGARVGEVTLRIWKHGVITGTVVDEAGEPLVNASVRCWRREPVGGDWRDGGSNASTDDRGVYRLPGLLPGEYVVGAAGKAVGWTARNQPLVAAGPAPRRFEGGLLRTGGGQSLLHPPTLHPSATTPARAATVEIGPGEERSGIDIRLHAVPTVRVSGMLVPAAAPGGVFVRLAPAGWDEGGIPGEGPMTQVRADGGFTFPAVPAGRFALRATMAPRSPSSSDALPTATWADVPVTVEGGYDIEGLTVVLRRGAVIRGYAEFEGIRDRPLPNQLEQIQIEIEPAGFTPAPVTSPSARSDEAGAFRSVGLAPGRYYVRVPTPPQGWTLRHAMVNGRDASSVPIDVGEEDIPGVVVTFTDRSTDLVGVVHSADGTPDAMAAVLAFPTDVNLWTEGGLNPRRLRLTRTDASGRYQLRNLPPGAYYVIAVPDAQADGWRERRVLDALARHATVVTIFEGEHKAQHLRTSEVP